MEGLLRGSLLIASSKRLAPKLFAGCFKSEVSNCYHRQMQGAKRLQYSEIEMLHKFEVLGVFKKDGIRFRLILPLLEDAIRSNVVR